MLFVETAPLPNSVIFTIKRSIQFNHTKKLKRKRNRPISEKSRMAGESTQATRKTPSSGFWLNPISQFIEICCLIYQKVLFFFFTFRKSIIYRICASLWGFFFINSVLCVCVFASGSMEVKERRKWDVSGSYVVSHFGTSGISVAAATGITHPLGCFLT